MVSKTTGGRLEGGVLIVVFVSLIALPLIDLGFGIDRSPALDENRSLPELPQPAATLDSLYSFPQEFETFFEARFGFRAPLVRLHNALLSRSTGSVISDKVLIGADGWLFYYPAVRSYLSPQLLSSRETTVLVYSIEARRRFLAAHGIHYLVVLVPNKAEVYPEHLPPSYRRSPGPTRSDQLIDALAAASPAAVVDLRRTLPGQKEQGQLYHRTDSHWTDLGIILSCRQIASHLRERFPALPEYSEHSFEALEPTTGAGDLARMIGLSGIFNEEISRRAWRHPPQPHAPGTGVRAVIVHDSFGELIPPFLDGYLEACTLAGSFEEAARRLRGDPPDVIIEQVVERFLIPRFAGSGAGGPRPSE